MSRAKEKNQVYASLAALRAEEAQLLPQVERLAKVRAAIAALEEYAAATRQRAGIRINTPKEGPFSGLSLPDAAMKQLELAGPQTAAEIWKALSEGGVTLTTQTPLNAVHWALRRRAKNGANVHVVNKKWALKPVEPSKGGMANRDHETHVQKTKAGIAHFKKRTGAPWGRRRTITAEHIAKFRELYDTGDVSVHAATKQAGMSNAYFYSNREAILSWATGDPWPPPSGISGDELRAMGIIPIHSKLVGEK